MIERDIYQQDPFIKYKFPRELRRIVREEQGGICMGCGQKPKTPLEVHHRIPHSLGIQMGIPEELLDSRNNAVGLCPPCHETFNQFAFEEGMVYPGVALEEAPFVLFPEIYDAPTKP